jgi:hypothetical protein
MLERDLERSLIECSRLHIRAWEGFAFVGSQSQLESAAKISSPNTIFINVELCEPIEKAPRFSKACSGSTSVI